MVQVRPPPFFIGNDLALDFLNTVGAPWGEVLEWLGTGGDLLAWLEHAHALPADVSSQFRAHTSARALDAVAAQARDLREWFRSFVGHHAGKPLGRSALRELAPINELLGRDEAYRQIEVAPPGEGVRALGWQARRRWDGPKSLLLPMADAIGDLVCRQDFTLVRKCEGCTVWFLDVSKSHARRWCSMAICGNRAKAAAHRARQASKPVQAQ